MALKTQNKENVMDNSSEKISKSNIHSTKNKNKENLGTQKVQKRKSAQPPLGENNAKRILNKDYSFRVLEEKKTQENENREAIYDFTFNPSDEPAPQKKKRKQVTKKKPQAKPKPVFINNNYDANILKTLQSLRATVNKKKIDADIPESVEKEPSPIEDVTAAETGTNVKSTNATDTTRPKRNLPVTVNRKNLDADLPDTAENEPSPIKKVTAHETGKNVKTSVATISTRPKRNLPLKELNIISNDITPKNIQQSTPEKSNVIMPKKPQQSTPDKSSQNNVVNIEAQWSQNEEEDDLNYSPVRMSFDNVLSSTLNNSVRHSMRQPQDSPWRPDFEHLPFKWQSNSYVKPNMTPAVETSFVVSDKKHVYTNMLPDPEDIPDKVETVKESPKLRQSTMLSFLGDGNERRSQRIRNKKKVDGPSRAQIPSTALKFAPNSEVVNELYDKMKATEEPEQQITEENVEKPNADENALPSEGDDGSVHLFEDIDVVHHLKPTRKSYGGKAKKLTFCKTLVDNTANVDDHNEDEEESDAEQQALDDLTFEIPNIKTKKAVKKKKGIKLTKKEEEELEAWAAAFNSMCEDVDEFPLLIE